MIEMIVYVRTKLTALGLWVLSSLSTPTPGVIYSESVEEDDPSKLV